MVDTFYACYPLLARRLHSLLAAGVLPAADGLGVHARDWGPERLIISQGVLSVLVCVLHRHGMASGGLFCRGSGSFRPGRTARFARCFLPAGVPWPARVLLRAFDQGGLAKLSYYQLRVTLTLHVFRDAW